jgi:ribonuclease-3
VSVEHIQAAIGYAFKDVALLNRALTHSSYTHENKTDPAECNERLEFLGDAVLELTISDYLYRAYNHALSEGELTKRRAGLVCEPSLAELARKIDLGAHMRFGRGEAHTGGRERDSLLADAMEALFGAVYMDGGIDCAREVILRLFTPQDLSQVNPITDHKTTLQEILQKNGGESAVYTTINETGPPHRKEFTAQVSHQGRTLGTGMGRSKKEAEQNAAKEAIYVLSPPRPH